MRVGSLFAGIGGFDLGFERAGMQTAWQVEIDPKCRELLAARFPHASQYEDVRACGAANLEPVDVVCGGFPCQDLSVAGKRAGLAGARSGLFYEMARIVDELQPAWFVWENVPGLLSSHRGRDFAAILVELERIGYHGAWTTLDARYFGVAQRRRRIFGVFARGDSGAERAAAVLALAARLRGNPAPRGEAREPGTLGPALANRARGGGGLGTDAELDGATIVTPARQAGSPTYERGDGSLFCVPTTTGTLNPGAHPGSYNGQDAYSDMLIAATVRAAGGHHGHSSPRGDGSDNIVPTLRVGGRDQGAGDSYDNTPVVAQPVHIQSAAGVRRLTPTECERLQGFPDGWTEGFSDTHRYRMLGNAVAVPCAAWIGKRLMKQSN